ncbi:hypothetical protein NX059_007365 [Plenodomus lindquistii]|nr:hypothetical protein NX059_007365 [Plenodomus lindquistii]
MPPHGLYPMSRHHLSGQMPPSARPVFNSMDFGAETPEPTLDTNSHDNGSERKNKDKKKKKKHSLGANGDKQQVRASSAPSTPAVAATPPTVGSKSRKSKSKNSKSERDAAPSGTSTQKRKRQSTAQDDAPTINRSGSGHDGLLNGSRFLEDIKSSLGDLGAAFRSPPNTINPVERPAKKSKKASRKSEGDVTAIDATNLVSNVVSKHSSKNKTQEKNERKNGDLSNHIAASPAKPPVLVPAANSPLKTPVPVPNVRPRQASTPLKTPIPLPQNSVLRRNVAPIGTPQTNLRATDRDSDVLVSETPPSQMSRSTTAINKTPIPFSLSQSTLTPTGGRKKSKNVPTIDKSPLSPTEPNQMSSSAQTNAPSQEIRTSIAGNALLTTSNLMQYKQALNDEPKPRPRARSSSIAPSTLSSDSNRSIKDMFLRVNKPYTRSGAENDPFTTSTNSSKLTKKSKSKTNKRHETHDEANLQTFTAAYTSSQRTVNFTDEQEYLTAYTSFKLANDNGTSPLPCLNKLTGCNPKREQVLRLTRDDPSPMLKVRIASESDTAALTTAHTSCLAAETLLTLSIPARVPIPLGRIDGVWKLYCPRYAHDHVDMYAFGQRTLSISPIAGFTSGSTYTARLSLPPRSMAFTILSFDAPPHASFRSTTLKTGAEGYNFDVVFLGNGYLKMWVDLQELLMGRKMEGGKKMEVWGVREGAVRWEEEVDELEVVGRRLCRAYDGE